MAILLAADIGGTWTRLALYTYTDHSLRVQVQERYESKKFRTFSGVLKSFLAVAKMPVDTAVFACAGPIQDNTVRITNLPWNFSGKGLERQFHIDRVVLINDVQAVAHAIPDLGKLENLTRNKPDPAGNKAILAPGTGLGMAVLVKCGAEWHAVPSEGGHADFAPVDPLQIQLLVHIAKKRRADIECVLSGPGIVNIYDALMRLGMKESPAVHRQLRKTRDASAVITASALGGEDALCVKTMDIFVDILAQAAGNLVLQSLATGGVYLAGGIASQVLPLLGKKFVARFQHKPPMQDVLKKIPVFVVQDQNAGLMGAATVAARLSEE